MLQGSSTSPVTQAERARANAMPRDQIEFWKCLYQGNFDLLADNNVSRAKAAGKKIFYVVEAGAPARFNLNAESQAQFCKHFIEAAATAMLASPNEGRVFYDFVCQYAKVAKQAEDAEKIIAELKKKTDALLSQEGIARAQLEAHESMANLEGSIQHLARKANIYVMLEKLLDKHGQSLGLDVLTVDQAVEYVGRLLAKIAEEQKTNFSSLLGELPDSDD